MIKLPDPKAKVTGGGADKFRIIIPYVVVGIACSFFYGNSSVGRMLGLGPRGRGFESRFPYDKCPYVPGRERD